MKQLDECCRVKVKTEPSQSRVTAAAGLVLLLIIMLSGCGGGDSSVSGPVTGDSSDSVDDSDDQGSGDEGSEEDGSEEDGSEEDGSEEDGSEEDGSEEDGSEEEDGGEETEPGNGLPEIGARELLRFTPALVCGDRIGRSDSEGEQFTEVSQQWGVTHEHGLSGDLWDLYSQDSDRLHAMNTGSVATLWLTGDCWPDLVFSGGPDEPVIVYRNFRGESFKPQAPDFLGDMPEAVTALGAADLTGNYRDDLVLAPLAADDGELRVYHGDYDQAPSLAQSLPFSFPVYDLAFGDRDGSGWPALYTAAWAGADGQALYDNDEGVLSTLEPGSFPAPQQGFAAGFADLDTQLGGEDGADLVVIAREGGSVIAQKQQGGLVNHPLEAGVTSQGLALGDFDGDGQLDFLVSGVFRAEGVEEWSWGESGNRFYKNQGAFVFEDQTDSRGVSDGGWSWGACAADFNNNGHLDLFVETGFGHVPEAVRSRLDQGLVNKLDEQLKDYHQARPRLFINDGEGGFTERGEQWGLTEETNGRGVVCTDLQRDGDVDIVVAQNSGPPRVYRNGVAGSSDEANFLGVSLHGAGANTAALGARVRLRTGERWQTRQVVARGGHNGRLLHFGLGAAGEVDEIVVEWPGGEETRLKQIPANRFLDIRHPELALLKDESLRAGAEDALEGAISWKKANQDNLEIDVAAFLAMAQRARGLSLGFDAAEAFEHLISEMDDERGARLSLLQRFYDPKSPVDEQVLNKYAENDFFVAALYCDDVPLDSFYEGDVMQAISQGGYVSTHVLLFVLFLEANNCTVALEDKEWKALLHSNLVEALDESVTDLSIEAMAFLSEAGRSDLIPESHVEAFLAAQNDDGGWSLHEDNQQSSSHATGLGIWLLDNILNAPQHSRPSIAQCRTIHDPGCGD